MRLCLSGSKNRWGIKPGFYLYLEMTSWYSRHSPISMVKTTVNSRNSQSSVVISGYKWKWYYYKSMLMKGVSATGTRLPIFFFSFSSAVPNDSSNVDSWGWKTPEAAQEELLRSKAGKKCWKSLAVLKIIFKSKPLHSFRVVSILVSSSTARSWV